MQRAAAEALAPPGEPGAAAAAPPPPPAAAAQWGTSEPWAYPAHDAYYAQPPWVPSPAGSAEPGSIPAAWGDPAAGWACAAAPSAAVAYAPCPGDAQLPPYLDPGYQQWLMAAQQQGAADPAWGPADPQSQACWGHGDLQQQQQQWALYQMAAQQQQELQMLAAFQQAQRGYFQAPQVPVFAISPPAPRHAPAQHPPPHCAPAEHPHPHRGLARKPKVALPAEPSFGCNGDGLDAGDSSAALVFSGEPSLSEVPEPAWEGAGPAAPAQGSVPGGPAPLARSASSGAAVAPAQGTQGQPTIAYDRAPRPVTWRPYTFESYQQRRFDAKAQAGGYWALGGLGPAHGAGGAGDPQWQAQQGKRERQQQFGQAVSGGCGTER